MAFARPSAHVSSLRDVRARLRACRRFTCRRRKSARSTSSTRTIRTIRATARSSPGSSPAARAPARRRGGLDFGCGPGPTLSKMFRESGSPATTTTRSSSTIVRCSREPTTSSSAPKCSSTSRIPRRCSSSSTSMLRPGGWLGVMTKRVTTEAAFATWHYTRDPSHVAFFADATFAWIARTSIYPCTSTRRRRPLPAPLTTRSAEAEGVLSGLGGDTSFSLTARCVPALVVVGDRATNGHDAPTSGAGRRRHISKRDAGENGTFAGDCSSGSELLRVSNANNMCRFNGSRASDELDTFSARRRASGGPPRYSLRAASSLTCESGGNCPMT